MQIVPINKKAEEEVVSGPDWYNANDKSLGLGGREDEWRRPGLTPCIKREDALKSFKAALFKCKD